MATIDHVRAAKNACLGDGNFWKHPESVRHNVVFSGVNKAWIQYKADTLLGGRPVRLQSRSGSVSKLKTGKSIVQKHDCWCTKSIVDNLFTQYSRVDPLDILHELDILDMALWYLDDGCTIERRDYIRKDGKVRYRYVLCVGSLCNTETRTKVFLSSMSKLFRTSDIGVVTKNNSMADMNNRSWQIPVSIGQLIVEQAVKLGVSGFENKLRTRRLTFNDHPVRE